MTLIDKFIPIFENIKKLSFLLSEDFDKTFLELEQETSEMLLSVSLVKYSTQQNADALFAVCALIDELILDSQWKYKDMWAKSPLQKKYFDTSNAGAEFYKRLDRLNESDPKDQDVREVYLYALVQGFSGCYFESGEHSLKQEIIHVNYALISKDITNSLFSPKVPEPINHGIKQVNRKKQKELAAVVAPIAIVLFTYLILRNDLINSVSQVLSQF